MNIYPSLFLLCLGQFDNIFHSSNQLNVLKNYIWCWKTENILKSKKLNQNNKTCFILSLNCIKRFSYWCVVLNHLNLYVSSRINWFYPQALCVLNKLDVKSIFVLFKSINFVLSSIKWIKLQNISVNERVDIHYCLLLKMITPGFSHEITPCPDSSHITDHTSSHTPCVLRWLVSPTKKCIIKYSTI